MPSSEPAKPAAPGAPAPIGDQPAYVRAAADGAAARRRGEPRDPTPYLPRYGEATAGASRISPAEAWLAAYDRLDALLAAEEAKRARKPPA